MTGTVDIVRPRAAVQASHLHCLGFRPIGGGSGPLVGTADFHIPRWRAKLRGCPVFRNADGLSVGPPTRPLIGQGGVVRKDAAGKSLHEVTVEFDAPHLARHFSELAVRALLEYAPELL